MDSTTNDLIDDYKHKSSPGKNPAFDNQMQIKEVYKQPLILCRCCKGNIGYQSFIIESNNQAAMLSTMSTINVEELIMDSDQYLVVSCTICEAILGLKYVELFLIFLEKNVLHQQKGLRYTPL